MVKFKVAFEEFANCHDEYQETLEDDEDKLDSEEYYQEVDKSYLDVLSEIRDYADDARTPDAVSSSVKLAQALTLPRVDIEVFDGNPTMFHSFITLFDECVDKVTDNVQTKLTRLFQFTTRDAKEAIRSCGIVGGENGYLQARSILKRRFGNDHLMSTRLTQNLRIGRPIRSPIEIQKLADELANAQMILLPMKQLHEVDTQCTIMDIVSRLPRYGHDKWVQRANLDYRRKTVLILDIMNW